MGEGHSHLLQKGKFVCSCQVVPTSDPGVLGLENIVLSGRDGSVHRLCLPLLPPASHVALGEFISEILSVLVCKMGEGVSGR